MKRLFIVISVVIILHLATMSVFASPTLPPPIVFRDFSDFNELRDMGENATEDELQLFLQRRGYYEAGITNRNGVRAFVNIVGQAFIPVLPDMEGVDWEIFIPNGNRDRLRHQGFLSVRYDLPNGIPIVFSSYYGSHYRRSSALSAISRFDAPTFVRHGASFYQSLSGHIDFFDFVIIIDDYVLTATFVTNEDFSIEARRAEMEKFSFVRLEDNESLGQQPAWPLYLAIIALSAFFIAITVKIIRNLRLGASRNHTEN